jgi:DNA-binding MarR family transcriptional regulator
MTDVTTRALQTASSQAAAASSEEPAADQDIIELIELLFFAYRDFVSDPDRLLAAYGFGRAHHRVLHFVGRNPGIRVQELLDILRITKQSLGRVLRELIEKQFVHQLEGEDDRRQRLLFLTPEGAELHASLMAPQIARIRQALIEAGEPEHGQYRRVLGKLVDQAARDKVGRLTAPRRGQS